MKQEDIALLEKAAKAAGYTVDGWWGEYLRIGVDDSPKYAWNAFHSEQDAFRLQVRMHFRVEIGNYETRVFNQWEDTALSLVYFKDTNGDEYAATCRAMVEAAAIVWDRKNGNSR